MATIRTFLWVRPGDTAEYENFGDDLDAVIKMLREFRVGPVVGWCRFGVQTACYSGKDYISLFWGDEDGNGVSDLTADEKRIVKKALEEAT